MNEVQLTREQIQQWKNETIIYQGCWVAIIYGSDSYSNKMWLELDGVNNSTMRFKDFSFPIAESRMYQGVAFFLHSWDEHPITSFPFVGGPQAVVAGNTFTISTVKVNINSGGAA